MKLGPPRKVRAAGLEIQYRIARSAKRVRSIAVQVKPDGTVIARAPAGISTGRIDHLIAQKATWISAKQISSAVQLQREFRSGESIAIFGRHLRLRITETTLLRSVRIEQTGRWLRIEIPKLTPARRRLAIRRAIIRWYRERAAEKLPTRISRFARQLGITAPRLLIRDQLRRWASCSPDGTLRFNWRLAMAPLSLVDYVVAHELCHLRHPNHSSAFWAALRSLLPDYAARRAELQSQGKDFAL
jgi:predicted metal-dependent hydrolase